MGYLLDALSHWPGSNEMGLELARRKLLVPEFYRTKLISYCKAQGESGDLNLYWDELAKEAVFNGGGGHSKERNFRTLEEVRYRSKYLDELAEARRMKWTYRTRTLHPCLAKWEDEELRRMTYQSEFFQELEAFKMDEQKAHNLEQMKYSGLRSELKRIFGHYLKPLGFREEKVSSILLLDSSKAFVKTGARGLVFYAWLDTGGRKSKIWLLPITLWVSHVNEPNSHMLVATNTIYAGVSNYLRFQNPDYAPFGLYAIAQFFGIFASMFE